MTGTDQVRHCAECNRQVYDLSKMTRRQAEHLIIITQGRFCARITRGPNGDVVTQEEPGLHLITKHASPVATAVVSAAITVGSAAPDLAGIHRQQTQVSVAAKTKESASVSIDAPGAAVLSGKVSDAEGAVSGARLVLRSSTLDERATSSSEGGEYRFEGLDAGPYTLIVLNAPSGVAIKSLAFEPAEQKILDVTLAVVTQTTSGGAMSLPQTLRLLYDNSDLIAIGRALSSSPGSRAEGDQVNTQHPLTSVLKGKSRRQKISVMHYGSTDENFAEGKTALLFLSKGNSENGGSRGAYVLADFNTGIKALVQADIDVYATRIRDLEAIERRDHTPADIIEWLVQCAEDPVTRWEGAYELATESAESLDQEQSGDKPAFRVVKGDPGNEPDQVKPEPVSIDSSSMTAVAAEDKTDSDEEEDSPSENLVARLTETQKERLVTSLLTTQTITEGDLKLIEVIKVWKDPRLVDFLLERLRGMEDNPPEIADQL